MKKLLGVSIAAMLAVSPMMANAGTDALGSARDSTVAYSNGTSTKGSITGANTIATTTYVQGAYDALATGHNALDTRVGRLESSAETEGSVLHAVKNFAENGTYTPDANTKNLTGVSDLNTAIDTLDTNMGKTGDLSKNISGTAFGTGAVLNGHTGSLVEAVQKIAAAVDSADTDSTVATGTYIGKNANNSKTVSGALTALDNAANVNATAIDAILDSNITVYDTWGDLSSTKTVNIRDLQGTGTGFPKEPAPAVAADQA